MDLDDVAPDDMQIFARHDPIDAALGGASDDPAVDALVRDLRAAYLPDGSVARSGALMAFAGELDPAGAATPPVRQVPVISLGPGRHRRAAVAAAAFAASLGGKLVLGTAVAAAAVGGLHATEVVDVPFLPDVARQHVPEAPSDVSDPLPLEDLLDSVPHAPDTRQDGRVADAADGSSLDRLADVPAPDSSTRADIADRDDRNQGDAPPVAPAPRPAPDPEAPRATPEPTPDRGSSQDGSDAIQPHTGQDQPEQGEPTRAETGPTGSPDGVEKPRDDTAGVASAALDQESRITP